MIGGYTNIGSNITMTLNWHTKLTLLILLFNKNLNCVNIILVIFITYWLITISSYLTFCSANWLTMCSTLRQIELIKPHLFRKKIEWIRISLVVTLRPCHNFRSLILCTGNTVLHFIWYLISNDWQHGGPIIHRNSNSQKPQHTLVQQNLFFNC